MSPTVDNFLHVVSDLDLYNALRNSTRACTKYLLQIICCTQICQIVIKASTPRIDNLFVPRNIQEALDDPNWKVAIMKEMNALRHNGMWEIVDLPRDKKLVGCKSVLER